MSPEVADPTPTCTSEPPHARSDRFPCFDGLRALAAGAVFIRHSGGRFALQDPSFASDAVQNWINRLGFFGIAVFFVISGFLLFRPFALASLDGRRPPRLLPFWKRRCFRIFPAYWAALGVAVFVFGQAQFQSLGQGVTVFALAQTYRDGYLRVGLGVAWTLVVEVSFYVVLPSIAWFLDRISASSTSTSGKVRTQALALIAMAVVSFGVRAWYFSKPRSGFAVPGPWFASELSRFWLPSYLDWFALGMGMALVSAWSAVDGRVPRVLGWLGDHAGWAWGAALGCYWVMTEFGIDPIRPGSLAIQGEVVIRWAMTGLAAAFFVLPAVFGPQSRGAVRSLLQTRALIAGGVISYGIYLWHLPLWIQAAEWLPPGVPMAVQMAAVLGLTLVVATASWHLVERPMIRWASRRAPGSSASSLH
ncbi:MAG: acyltransferase [Acidimicrobiia bacterium]